MRSTLTTVRNDPTTIPVSSTLRLSYLQGLWLRTVEGTQPLIDDGAIVCRPSSIVKQTSNQLPTSCTSCHVTTSSSRSFPHKPFSDCYDPTGCPLYVSARYR